MAGDQEEVSLQQHKMLAKSANGETWQLLSKMDRSNYEDQEMVMAASASLYHWKKVGEGAPIQRGFWLLARVWLALDRPELAAIYAEHCMNVTMAEPAAMSDFDVAYAHEGLARTYANLGKTALAKDHYLKAAKLGEAIADDEDKEIFMADFSAGEWPGIK